MEYCIYREVECDCGQTMLAWELIIHERDACPDRFVSCEHCDRRVKARKLARHKERQEDKDIPCSGLARCPHDCKRNGTPLLLRLDEVDEHCESCPRVWIACEVCDFRMRRGDKAEHNSANADEHVRQLLQRVYQLEKEKAKLNTRVENLVAAEAFADRRRLDTEDKLKDAKVELKQARQTIFEQRDRIDMQDEEIQQLKTGRKRRHAEAFPAAAALAEPEEPDSDSGAVSSRTRSSRRARTS